MPHKTWTADHKGHSIRLHNHWSLFPHKSRGEWIEVDGATVVSGKTSAWLDLGARLNVPLEIEGDRLVLEGRLGWDGYKLRGQILVDGETIGGDASMGGLARRYLQKTVDRGFMRHVVVSGMLSFGLPFGLTVSVAQYLTMDLESDLMFRSVGIWTVFYGGMMGICTYVMRCRAYRKLYADLAP
ncbi:hypothetical protein [Shimia sp. R9_3]|uniref:hypothetical protein n=1 Tax=Shimia sp. R9_3 TaxID=2821113 RepID=UPI001ADB611A|nr:hypothetical protein [Shimia sp. R9_3]MBO9401903.1 hypothetical protein [Shimia sp. R9_3]